MLTINKINKSLLAAFLILAATFKSNACSPLQIPTLVSQSIVGSNLVLNWRSTTVYWCPDQIDVEIACSGMGSFSGSAAYTYTSATVTGTSNPYNYPAMSIPIGSLCPGTVYRFRARERNIAGSFVSPWSGTFTFTTPGVAVANTATLTSTSNTFCINGSSQLTLGSTGCGPGPKSYSWSPSTGLSCTTCSNPIASPTVTTVYTGTVNGGQLGCWNLVRNVTLTVNNCFLPIGLISFDVFHNDNSIHVNWKTSTEKDNKSFSVLRSEDGINFDMIAEIAGAGNSSSPKNYSYYDTKVEHGKTYYYRLKHTDFNGEENEIRHTVSVMYKNKKYVLNVFPNPADNEFYIISDEDVNNVQVEILNSLGQKIKTIPGVNLIRNERFAIDIKDLMNGCHQLVVTGGGEIIIQKKIVTYK